MHRDSNPWSRRKKTEIKRFMAASQGVTSIWSRSQAPPSSRSQTPEAIVGQRLSAQKPAEDITWESNSNKSKESRSSNFLSRCASHVDRVLFSIVLSRLFRIENPRDQLLL